MDLNQFEQYLYNKFQTIDFNPILKDIETVISSSIARNFKEGGRFGNEILGGGSNKWKPSIRSTNQSGETLRDTGILRNSISVDVKQVGNGLQIQLKSGTNYSAIHNFGGIIKRAASSKIYIQNRFSRGPKKGKFKKGTTSGRGTTNGSYTISMPARPFLVIQDEDILEIKDLIMEFLLNYLVKNNY
jgi:phage gpG-like protein